MNDHTKTIRFSFFASMKGRLTLGAAALLFPAALVLLYVTNAMVEDLDHELVSALRARAETNAKSVASQVSFELATKEKKGALTKIREFRKKNTETHSLAILRETGVPFAQTGAQVDAEGMVELLGTESTGGVKLLGDLMVAVYPVRMDDEKKKLAGYVVYTESLAAYRAKVNRLVTISYGVTIGMFTLLLAGVFLIGYRAAAPMSRLMEAAQRIAAGDLRDVDIPDKGSSETRRLAEVIRAMALAMQGQVSSIKQLTAKVAKVTREVAGAMTHLATSAVQQAAAVTETASTVEEMEKAGQSAADNAVQITEAAEKTTEASIRGQEAVEDTSALIVRIKGDSGDISSQSRELLETIEEVTRIISSVNDIAEQSKILAVNASIEAAKAGEYGAGFAVVAQEVKDLALQSKESMHRINATLGAAQQAIGAMVEISEAGAKRSAQGVKVIANAGAIVNDLSDAIQVNSELAVIIAGSMKQQAVGLTQIATAVDQINTSAVENQDISRRISDETQQLTDSVEELRDLVDRWQTPTEERTVS